MTSSVSETALRSIQSPLLPSWKALTLLTYEPIPAPIPLWYDIDQALAFSADRQADVGAVSKSVDFRMERLLDRSLQMEPLRAASSMRTLP